MRSPHFDLSGLHHGSFGVAVTKITVDGCASCSKANGRLTGCQRFAATRRQRFDSRLMREMGFFANNTQQIGGPIDLIFQSDQSRGAQPARSRTTLTSPPSLMPTFEAPCREDS